MIVGSTSPSRRGRGRLPGMDGTKADQKGGDGLSVRGAKSTDSNPHNPPSAAALPPILRDDT